jgi:hypothetical protein
MFIIVLNQTNIVQDGLNNKLVYKFPNSIVLTDKYIAVSKVSMYYSWFNISAQLGNNTFSYQYTSASSVSTVTIPDGIYTTAQINAFLQFTFIQNGHYWTANTNTTYYYPIEIVVNPTRYAIQINTFLLPTSTSWNGIVITAPPAGFAPSSQNSIITLPSSFSTLLGYRAGFASNNNPLNAYTPPTPPTAATNFAAKSTTVSPVGTLSYLSNTSPNVTPTSTILFSLSNINNPYSQPSSIIYSLSSSVLAGQQIIDSPPNFMWNKMISGTYNELRMTILGTNLSPIQINDPDMTIMLTIRDKDEHYNR